MNVSYYNDVIFIVGKVYEIRGCLTTVYFFVYPTFSYLKTRTRNIYVNVLHETNFEHHFGSRGNVDENAPFIIVVCEEIMTIIIISMGFNNNTETSTPYCQ